MDMMMTDASDAAEEYQVLVEEAGWDRVADQIALKRLRKALITTAEWTPEGAHELVSLAKTYGSFMLRNALALAVALDIEDGDAGF